MTLIGQPTAAAVPLTVKLLDAYDEWLDLERSFLKWERYGSRSPEARKRAGFEVVYRNRQTGELFDFRACNRLSGYGFGRDGDSPASRAAVVLSAVVCDWERTGL